jgi:hypothetical protein
MDINPTKAAIAITAFCAAAGVYLWDNLGPINHEGVRTIDAAPQSRAARAAPTITVTKPNNQGLDRPYASPAAASAAVAASVTSQSNLAVKELGLELTRLTQLFSLGEGPGTLDPHIKVIRLSAYTNALADAYASGAITYGQLDKASQDFLGKSIDEFRTWATHSAFTILNRYENMASTYVRYHAHESDERKRQFIEEICRGIPAYYYAQIVFKDVATKLEPNLQKRAEAEKSREAETSAEDKKALETLRKDARAMGVPCV